MFGDQVVLQHVEQQVLLPENFNPDRLVLVAVLLPQLLDEVLRLLVQEGSIGLLAVAVGSHYKEAANFGGCLDHALDELFRDGFVGEVEDDGNGGVVVLGVLHVQGGEELEFFSELVAFEAIVELGEGHVLLFVIDHIAAGLHDFEDGLEDAEVSAGLALHQLVDLGVAQCALLLHAC